MTKRQADILAITTCANNDEFTKSVASELFLEGADSVKFDVDLHNKKGSIYYAHLYEDAIFAEIKRNMLSSEKRFAISRNIRLATVSAGRRSGEIVLKARYRYDVEKGNTIMAHEIGSFIYVEGMTGRYRLEEYGKRTTAADVLLKHLLYIIVSDNARDRRLSK